MKKINDFFRKNIESIIIIFIISQPIIDLITSLTVKLTSADFTLGIIIRGFALLFFGYYYLFCINERKQKTSILYLILLVLYFFAYLINVILFKDLSVLFVEIKFLIKAFYFPLSLLFIYNIIKNRNINIKNNVIIIPIIFYVVSIILAIITKTDYSSYNSYKIGTSGWYYAANEIGTIIGILAPVFIICCINIKNWIIKYLFLFSYIIVSLVIGTKVPFFGVIFSLLIFLIYLIIKYLIMKNKESIRNSVFTIVICFIFFFFIFSYLPGGKNLEYHLKLFNLNNIFDVFNKNNDEKQPNNNNGEQPNNNNGEQPNNNNGEQPNETVVNNKNPMNVIYSSRDIYLSQTKAIYKNSTIWQKLTGIGSVENFGTIKQTRKLIEMDFHDLFYRFGVLGFILYLLFPIIFLINCIKIYFKKIRKLFLDQYVTALIISLFLSLSISFIAGHNLIAPAVSIYTVLILIILKTSLKNKGELINNTKTGNSILGINVCDFSYIALINNVIKDIKNNKKNMIIAINPEKIIKARKNKKLKRIINNTYYTIPDGIGIIIASKLNGGSIKNRVTGIDCMKMICDKTRKIKAKIFLYGSSEDTVNSAKLKLQEEYPGINIVGTFDGYQKDELKVINMINKSKADILFVALGSPKQEFWMHDNFEKLNVKILQGVGGSFDVISGKINRAPEWYQKRGLEWFYRLVKEPKRIFRQLNLLKFLFLIIIGKKD